MLTDYNKKLKVMYFTKVFILCGLNICAWAHDNKTVDQSHSVDDTINKLLNHAKYDLQDAGIAMLLKELKDARAYEKNGKHVSTSLEITSIYTRWGRKTCPAGASLVYEGFAAGGNFEVTGAPANYLCLPQSPEWDNKSNNPQHISHIYGAEYELHNSIFQGLTNHDVPCAVCQVPRSSVVMVPGKNTCFKNFVKEYTGYLMAGYPIYNAASEYVCVDGEPEQASKSLAHNHNGKLFYFVRAKCGSLKCPPYKEDDDLTCVVCSYLP
ncbi:short-chain collagen C4-like [Ruditapes philippinarum]|uniref:short-chain collagen C4-like n=1 Tax=Ruditapes philippinarum TaxID=129788 RepID=UPI00295BDAE6|nr:short-chain collagen C4-like [Ruditapes philippinarum]